MVCCLIRNYSVNESVVAMFLCVAAALNWTKIICEIFCR